MNPYALTGLGAIQVSPDQIATIFTSAATTDPKTAAVTGAIVGAKVFGVIGATFGAALGYIGAGIAGVLKAKPVEKVFEVQTKNGLAYGFRKPQSASEPKVWVLIEGIFKPCKKCPLIGSCDVCRNLNTIHRAAFTSRMLQNFVSDPEKFLATPWDPDIKARVTQIGKEVGFEFNSVPTLIYEEPNGLTFAIVGGQIYSNAPEQQQQSSSLVSQAGFGWVVGLLALSVVGGLLWKANQNKKKS